jgi:TonB family protein
MRRTSAFIYGATAIFCMIRTPLFGSAQDQSSQAPPSSRPLKVCSAQNPPPCATAPRPISTPDPEYTDKARKKKIHGKVILDFVVGIDGRTQDIRVSQPLGYGLDEQAVKSLRNWTFEPGTKDGQPVPVAIQVEMNFRLY